MPKAKELYDTFIGKVRSIYREDRVKDGVFQAMMDVGLVNDGPVGVDYRCQDEAVRIAPFLPPILLSRHLVSATGDVVGLIGLLGYDRD